jgi:hypothetical protein
MRNASINEDDKKLLTKADNTETSDAEFDDKTKKKILVSCLFALAIGNMMLDNVYATLPKYVDERNCKGLWSVPGFEFSEVRYTIILVMFSIA